MGSWHQVQSSALAALVDAGAAAQTPMELGPIPTRDMFPLYLPTLAYQPVDPTPLGLSLIHI